MTTASAFDTQRPPSSDDVADCVHCGFCLPACPTYVLWGKEADSPRGRIHLVRVGLEGQVGITEEFRRHFDTCLGCMACLTACPSGVRYDRIVDTARPQIERHLDRSIGDRFFRRLIFSLFPYPERLRWVALTLWGYQTLGVRWLVHAARLIDLLPSRLRALETVTPDVSIRAIWSAPPERLAPAGEPRRRVGLLLGCVQRVFFSDVNAATARVLVAEGCEVVIPRAQGCCGALMVHAGLDTDAADMARRLVDTFERAEIDTIVTNAAGCGSTLKEYGELLRDDPVYGPKAEAFAAKCKDISEVLAELEPRAPRHPVPLTVAYHDACHLQHAQGVSAEPRQVLATIPGLEVREIPDGGLCCGSAGIYNLIEPDTARELGKRKVANILATGAEAVVSSNPGCLLQIGSGVRQADRDLPTFHLVELVDASIRGEGLPIRS